MRTPRRGFRPNAEDLEGRMVLSALGSVTSNLQTSAFTVTGPHAVARPSLDVTGTNLAAHRHATIIGLTARPTAGSPLQPRIVGASKGIFHAGAPYSPRGHRYAQGYVKLRTAGPFQASVAGQGNTSGTGTITNYLPGDLDGNGKVDTADLNLFPSTYLSKVGGNRYIPAADANRNGFVGMDDAKILLHNLPGPVHRRPINVDLALKKGQYSNPRELWDSGGITTRLHVTVVGRTTPNSLIFSDSGLGDFKFQGSATTSNSRGFFSFDFDLDPEDRLKNTEYLVITKSGQQKIRAFPILLER